MNIWSKALTAVAGTAMLASPAGAACWTDEAYKAAQVRELDTMLMVEALRCRKTAANFVTDYNRFIQVSRPALIHANTTLKGHFARTVGERGALNAYDNYMTTVANRYGAGSEGLDCEDIKSMVRAAVAAKGSADELHRLAVTAEMVPAIDGDRCRTVRSPTLAITMRR